MKRQSKQKTQDYILRAIPEELHRAAKVRAAQEGKTLRDIIIEGIKLKVAEKLKI